MSTGASTPLPTVSVVVPSLNQGHFIRETLDSILSQDYPGLEVIVVDGGSTDDTREVLAGYGDRLSWTSEKDTGQSNAINKGLARASGEIVCFLNSDDLFTPGSLHAVGTYFAKHPSVQWLTGACRIIDENGRPIRAFIDAYKALWRRFAMSRWTLLVLNYIPQPATFWRRSAMLDVGLIDESLHWAMDYDYWLRLSKLGRPANLPQCLASFRIHSSSKSATNVRSQFDEGVELARIHGGPLVAWLNRIHQRVALWIYQILYGQGKRAPSSRET